MEKPDLCVFHANCNDGFGAAFALWKVYGDSIAYFPGFYGAPPPDMSGLHVAIVDFSYKRPVMIDIASKAKTVLVLDHHITAKDELTGLDLLCPNTYTVFDMNKSGAVLAWEHYHPDEPLPLFFAYLQDRDLWTNSFPDIKTFTRALDSYPKIFQVWDTLFQGSISNLIAEGIAIERYYRILVEEAKRRAFYRDIDGHVVPVVNGALLFASEVAGELAEGAAFAAMYIESTHGTTWSLRSRDPGGLDVAKIAAKFGGGGHAHAAGFTVPRS